MSPTEILTDAALEQRVLLGVLSGGRKGSLNFPSGLESRVFSDPCLRAAFQRLKDIANETGPDERSIAERVEKVATGMEFWVGGAEPPGIEEPGTEDVRRLTELAFRREAAALLESICEKTMNLNCDLESLVNSAFVGIEALKRDIGHYNNGDMVRESVLSMLEDLERTYEIHGAPQGISTGIPLLDRLTKGLLPGKLYFIAAKPGAGKTAFANTLACNARREDENVVVSIPAERLDEVVRRLFFLRSKCDQIRFLNGLATEADFFRIESTASEMCIGERLILHAPPRRSIDETRGLLSRLHWTKPGMVIVDDLHLFEDCTSPPALAKICREIRAAAVNHRIAAVVFCNLGANRMIRQRGWRGMRHEQLFEIEADMAAVLQRSRYGSLDPLNSTEVELEVIRNSGLPIGSVPLFFNPEFQCHEEPESDEDDPDEEDEND